MDCCRLLVEEYCEDVDSYDFQRMTALHHAAKRGHPEVVKYLLNAGATKEIVNAIGQTPLHVACQTGQYDVVQVLLSHGADPNTSSDHDMRPIHRVAKKGFHEVANLLIKSGADLQVADSFLQECAIHHAASEGHVEVIRILMCHAKRCLDDVNSRGESALHMAASANHLETCKVLLMMSMSPKWKFGYLNLKDLRQEETALHKCCLHGHTEVARLLLDEKAIPNLQNVMGRTALHLATAADNPQLIQYLLRAGADHTLLDYDGKRPLQYCKSERVKMALAAAAGIPAQAQTHMTMSRQLFIDEKRQAIKADETRKVLGTDDNSLVKDAENAKKRRARLVQDRLDRERDEVVNQLRRTWASKAIARHWRFYRAKTEESVRPLVCIFPDLRA